MKEYLRKEITAGKRYSYVGYVRDYSRRFFKCPECGAEPGQDCTPDGRHNDIVVCKARFMLAQREVRDETKRREMVSKYPKAEDKPKPKAHSWREFEGKTRARKLREALAADGVIMRKEGPKYLIVRNGYLIGPLSLDAAVMWALSHHWHVDTRLDAEQKEREAAEAAAEYVKQNKPRLYERGNEEAYEAA